MTQSARQANATVADLLAADFAWAHALNQDNAEALSDMSAGGFATLVARARFARVIGPDAAFLLAFDRPPTNASPNFNWFARRYSGFIYVDRIAVDRAYRRQGCAKRLYEDLFVMASDAGFSHVACEVNADPPNPTSDAFHAALGFEVVGDAVLADRGKTVRYYMRTL